MENFIPESPRIKYMIPKVQPSLFSLDGENLEMNDIDEKDEFKNYDESSEEYKEDETNDYMKEKSLDSLDENSIFKTLLLIIKRKESASSFETNDSC